MQYLFRLDQHSHDFTSTPRPLSLARCVIPFSRHRGVRGGLTAPGTAGLEKHENARIEDENGFMSRKSSEYLYETPHTISLIERANANLGS